MTRRLVLLPGGSPPSALFLFFLSFLTSVTSFSFSKSLCSSSSVIYSGNRFESAAVPSAVAFLPLAMSTFEAETQVEEADEASDEASEDSDEEEEEEWIEEEFELLTEKDFYDTEWKIGTVMDSSPSTIATTWVRLTTTAEGTNLATWGDSNRILARGKWAVDVPSQFFSISRESFGGWLGKQIWAGTLEDYYFMEGTVRGWSPISPASVIGQWQGIRLGVSKEERGVAPWFRREETEEEGERVEEETGEEEQNEKESGNGNEEP
ncbi:hypothetical protein ACHAXS_002423 [Conticribra weissflogii]